MSFCMRSKTTWTPERIKFLKTSSLSILLFSSGYRVAGKWETTLERGKFSKRGRGLNASCWDWGVADSTQPVGDAKQSNAWNVHESSTRRNTTHDRMTSHWLKVAKNAVSSRWSNASKNESAELIPRVEVTSQRNHDARILSRIWLHNFQLQKYQFSNYGRNTSQAKRSAISLRSSLEDIFLYDISILLSSPPTEFVFLYQFFCCRHLTWADCAWCFAMDCFVTGDERRNYSK